MMNLRLTPSFFRDQSSKLRFGAAHALAEEVGSGCQQENPPKLTSMLNHSLWFESLGYCQTQEAIGGRLLPMPLTILLLAASV